MTLVDVRGALDLRPSQERALLAIADCGRRSRPARLSVKTSGADCTVNHVAARSLQDAGLVSLHESRYGTERQFSETFARLTTRGRMAVRRLRWGR